MSDELNLSMFRAYDIRTPSARLTPPLARRLADAEAAYFRDGLGVSGVVVAHDARSAGPRYLTIACDAYREAGLEVVYLPGVSSTSHLYYAAMRHPHYAAVMFGASHNPAGDTGRKIVGPEVAPIAEGIGPQGGLVRIKELYEAAVSRPGGRRGSIRACELTGDYIEYSMELAGVAPGGLRGTQVLHDYLFGAAGREMMLAFDRAGAELWPLHFTPDGTFPLGDPNPVIPAVIGEGLAAIATRGPMLATLFDGDGDRIDFYRGDGAYLASSFVYAAILPEIRRRFPGPGWSIFADLKSNPRAIVEMARCGVGVDVIRNGNSQIKKAVHGDLRRIGAVEESAHFYEALSLDGRRYATENTLYIALLTTRVWRDAPQRIAELYELQATTAREREWGYRFPTSEQRADALAAVGEHFASQGAQATDRMHDGADLEATLLRQGLPLRIDEHTPLAGDWLQVCQRVSQSETGLARWEVVGSRPERVREAKAEIAAIVRRFGAGGEHRG